MDFLFAHCVTGDTALLREVASFVVLSLPDYFQLGIIRCYDIILIRTEGMGIGQSPNGFTRTKNYLDFGGFPQQITVCDLLLADRIQKRRTSRKESSLYLVRSSVIPSFTSQVRLIIRILSFNATHICAEVIMRLLLHPFSLHLSAARFRSRCGRPSTRSGRSGRT